jgi:hypothetical protein
LGFDCGDDLKINMVSEIFWGEKEGSLNGKWQHSAVGAISAFSIQIKALIFWHLHFAICISFLIYVSCF